MKCNKELTGEMKYSILSVLLEEIEITGDDVIVTLKDEIRTHKFIEFHNVDWLR